MNRKRSKVPCVCGHPFSYHIGKNYGYMLDEEQWCVISDDEVDCQCVSFRSDNLGYLKGKYESKHK